TCRVEDIVCVAVPVWSPLQAISHTYDAVNVYVPGYFHPSSNPQWGVSQPWTSGSYTVPVPWHTVDCPSPSDHFTCDTFAVAEIVYGPAVADADFDGKPSSPTHNHTGTPTVPVHRPVAARHGEASMSGFVSVILSTARSRTCVTVTRGATGPPSGAPAAGTDTVVP
ncbi:hypothetical protein, partial [Janibacter anophelis]|uniref:hypothetical protein n=1 Tax=Janibacter anophelis TaxID=319054 RepID=UPI000AEB73F2